MDEISEMPFLIGTSGLVFVSFLFSVIAIATASWSTTYTETFLDMYNTADKDEKEALLWLVGIVVLVILGIICLCFTAVIVIARFFGHSQGRAKLAGFLCLFTAIIFLLAIVIFMVNSPPAESTYGYSFGLMWTAVPLSMAAGIIMMMLPDSAFLDSEVETFSASVQPDFK